MGLGPVLPSRLPLHYKDIPWRIQNIMERLQCIIQLLEGSRVCKLSWKCSCFIFSAYCCLPRRYGGWTSLLFFSFGVLFRDSQHALSIKSHRQFQQCVLLVTPAFIEERRLPPIKSHMDAKLWDTFVLSRVWIVKYRTHSSLIKAALIINRIRLTWFTGELDRAAHPESAICYIWLKTQKPYAYASSFTCIPRQHMALSSLLQRHTKYLEAFFFILGASTHPQPVGSFDLDVTLM